MEQLRLLKIKGQGIEPTVRVGKHGITESIISEIRKQLAKRKIVKIKFLKNFIRTRNKKELASELADKTGAIVVYHTGFIIVLAKK